MKRIELRPIFRLDSQLPLLVARSFPLPSPDPSGWPARLPAGIPFGLLVDPRHWLHEPVEHRTSVLPAPSLAPIAGESKVPLSLT
jgi:hypothetical protein